LSPDTREAVTATLGAAKSIGAGCSSSLKGYILGGWTTTVTNIIDSIRFSTDTREAVTATLGAAKSTGAGVQGYN
jgi:hypothetical protein